MFPITITLTTPNELAAVMAALNVSLPAVEPAKTAPTPKPKAEKAAPPPPVADTPPTVEEAPTAAPVEKPKPSAPSVDYAALSSSVLALMQIAPAAASEVAKSMGYANFKQMKEAEKPAEVFAEAKAKVDAKIKELKLV